MRRKQSSGGLPLKRHIWFARWLADKLFGHAQLLHDETTEVETSKLEYCSSTFSRKSWWMILEPLDSHPLSPWPPGRPPSARHPFVCLA